ncbi:MAG TPA: CHRD domain-containing protein, partial [Thermoflexus sp.]|nr:CHRD domain-containing protein [Thermoflexus sp.]
MNRWILSGLWVLGLILASGSGLGAASASRGREVFPGNFVAILSGDEERPPVPTRARGVALFDVAPDGSAIHYKLIVANIHNPVAAHIHLGPRGVNGPIMVGLFGPTPPGGGRFNGVLAEGTITAANLVGPLSGKSIYDLLEAMISGNAYVNVHTNDGVPPPNTGPGDMATGEIRGQIDHRTFPEVDPDQALLEANARLIASGARPSFDRAPRLRNLRLVGSLSLGGFNADVWGHRGFAYVGTWGTAARPDTCPATGVKVIDLADPANPQWVATVPGRPGTSSEDMVVARINTRFFHGDLLAVGIQRCVPFGQGAEGGLDLWDVTDPRAPKHLAFFSVGEGQFGRGVHEMFLFQRGDRAYALLADPFAELDTFFAGLTYRGLDFKLVDVTDPRNPILVSQWGAFTELGIPPIQPGPVTRVSLLHSVWANETGTMALLSYWDTGMVLLDITDPANPRFLGRTLYRPQEEGNDHSAIPVPGNRLAVVNDEDFTPQGPSGIEDGWGYTRIIDISDPTRPMEIATFATANARSTRTDGFFSVHNPFVRGRTLYLSWYSDGVRVVDLSQPAAPREIASFVPPAHPDPFNVFLPGFAFPFVWGVWVGGDT